MFRWFGKKKNNRGFYIPKYGYREPNDDQYVILLTFPTKQIISWEGDADNALVRLATGEIITGYSLRMSYRFSIRF